MSGEQPPGVAGEVRLLPVPGIPLVHPGEDLVALVDGALRGAGLSLIDGDVLVVAQKIVSKAEDRYVALAGVRPSPRAETLALEVDKDPRLVELILRESRRVLRYRPGVLIVEHHRGWVHANAGIDRSNIESAPGDPRVLLLPRDPDASAERLRAGLAGLWDVDVRIVINDSAGRAWRNGVCGFAVGCAGLVPLDDARGRRDLFGRELETTTVAVADEIAAAASVVMGQAGEGTPVVLVRGSGLASGEGSAMALIRPEGEDLFR